MLLHEEAEDEEDEEFVYLPVFHTSGDIFIQFFCMQLLFCMFSTLMSLEDRLRLKLKVKANIWRAERANLVVQLARFFYIIYI